MAQFRIHANTNSDTKAEFPFLLDVQSDLLSDLETRMVIPLASHSNPKYKSISQLTPLIEVKGKKYLALTPLMAGISKRVLGPEAADASKLRHDLIGAVDLLITGF
ncbi:MAG: CcdB family protein [Spirochaetota bacterium]